MKHSDSFFGGMSNEKKNRYQMLLSIWKLRQTFITPGFSANRSSLKAQESPKVHLHILKITFSKHFFNQKVGYFHFYTTSRWQRGFHPSIQPLLYLEFYPFVRVLCPLIYTDEIIIWLKSFFDVWIAIISDQLCDHNIIFRLFLWMEMHCPTFTSFSEWCNFCLKSGCWMRAQVMECGTQPSGHV